MRQPFPAELCIFYPRDSLTGVNGDSLSEVNVDDAPDGALCNVPGQGLYQLEKFSVEAVAPPTVLATGRGAASPGRWVQFVGGGGAAAPIRNTLYVDPDSTAAPANGTILAPYTTLQAAVLATVAGQRWTIILPPGKTITENIAIPGVVGTNIEITADGLDQGATINGNITWSANEGFLGLTNVVVTGNVTGTCVGATASRLILQNFQVLGNVSFTGAQRVDCFLNGSFPVTGLLALAFSVVVGDFATTGHVHARDVQFSGTSFSVGFRSKLENCAFENFVAMTCADLVFTMYDTRFQGGISAFTFSGGAGFLVLDQTTTFYADLFGFAALIVNGEINVEKQVRMPEITPAPITGTVNTYGSGITDFENSEVARQELTGAVSLTGMLAPPGGSPSRRIIVNIDTVDSLTCLHEDGGEVFATRRFSLPGAASLVIGPLRAVEFFYDFTSQRWRPLPGV